MHERFEDLEDGSIVDQFGPFDSAEAVFKMSQLLGVEKMDLLKKMPELESFNGKIVVWHTQYQDGRTSVIIHPWKSRTDVPDIVEWRYIISPDGSVKNDTEVWNRRISEMRKGKREGVITRHRDDVDEVLSGWTTDL